MAILTLAAKDLRLLMRDASSALILLVMPILLVGVLGMAVGEGFGQKPDDRLRISIVNLDEGLDDYSRFPSRRWSEVVIDDLASTADIRIEIIPSRAEAESLIRQGKRSAVLIFEKEFSHEVDRCSFLTHTTPEPLNPLFENGIHVEKLGLTVLRDPTQQAASSIIEQVAQVTMLRVVIPWMIGKAFERVGDDAFMEMIARHFGPKIAEFRKVKIAFAGGLSTAPREGSVPPGVLRELRDVVDHTFATILADEKIFKEMIELMRQESRLPAALIKPIMERAVPQLQKLLLSVFEREALLETIAYGISFNDLLSPEVRKAIGPGVKEGIKELFSNYNFTAKTWAGLTKHDENIARGANRFEYVAEPSGVLKRGAVRYQTLVPSYTVMFAFFLVLTVGWLFVAERRQGTLVRLRAAPLTRAQLLIGKLIPCMLLSIFQGIFLLVAGYLVFGMKWGSQPLFLLAVVVCTSFAAMGLAMLIAGLAKTETQVAVYGSLLVLLLGGMSGSMMPRELMPENMRRWSYVTPHAWALDAYSQLLTNPVPELAIVGQACLALTAFGLGFLTLAWWLIRLD